MRPAKEKIRDSFARASGTYDANSALQGEAAEGVAVWVENILMACHSTPACRCEDEPSGFLPNPLKIIDIGCGTGRLAGMLKERCSGSSVYGCDIAFKMLVAARSSHPGINGLIAADCEALPFADSSFDMVASSLAYQWSGDLLKSFKEAERILKPGGVFVFSTLGPETFRELRGCYGRLSPAFVPSMDFHEVSEVSGLLKETGLEVLGVSTTEVQKSYDSLLGLIKTLKGLGASVNAGGTEARGFSGAALLRRADALYSKLYPSPEGGVLATYEIIYSAARKPV